jgi:hypothetical protein
MSVGKALSFGEISGLFGSLGIQSFGAALPEGRIHWMDKDGRVVAHGRCLAVLSHAPGNDSVMWAAGIPSFTDAGVPVVPHEGEHYLADTGPEQAEALALDAANKAGGLFAYQAPTGGGGVLWLAITEFVPGALDSDPDEAERRARGARDYAAQTLSAVAEVLGDPSRAHDAAALLRSFAGVLGKQIEFVVAGLPVADSLGVLAADALDWAQALPAEVTRVRASVEAAAKHWA